MITTNNGCTFDEAKQLIEKVTSIGAADKKLENNFEITCTCGEELQMDTHVYICKNCQKTYGVTPCSSDSIENVVSY